MSTEGLNILSLILPLELCAKLERDFGAFARWGRSIEGTNLRPDLIEIWKTHFVVTISGEFRELWILSKGHRIRIIRTDLSSRMEN